MRREHLPLCALTAGLLTGLGLTIPNARGDAKPSTIGVEEIKDGMKGYGLTVFKGTTPERFDVEVIGVLKNFRPAQDLILVKTPHPRLNVTKAVAGMSGSPIYFDGRLAGAYAYSWSFPVEPMAGVTPIAPMLAELKRPIPAGFWPLEGGAPLPGGNARGSTQKHTEAERPLPIRTGLAYNGAPGTYDVEAHAQQIAARFPSGMVSGQSVVPAATPLMMGGMTDRSMALVKKLFEPLGLEPMQAGGSTGKTDPDAPLHYVDGGGLGIEMARGDVSMMGLGTVTKVDGTRLCGFGHPMMEAGVTAMPAAIGKVHWIFASGQRSSKMGEAVRSLGALVNDRQSAVIVDETKTAPMFPMTVDIHGADGIPKKNWKVEVVEERFMSASLAASVIGSVVDASVNERRDVTWRLVSKLKIRNHGTIELEDFGVAVGGMPDAGDFAHGKLVRAVGEVLNNPWELTHVDGIESVLTVDYSRDLWRLRGVDVLDPVVDAGHPARLRVHLVPFAGPETTKIIEVTFPEELAGKDVELEIAPGYTVAPDQAAPQNLADLLTNSTHQTIQPKSIVVQYRSHSQGVAFNGHVADRLPSFALDALRPVSSDTGPEAFPSYSRVVVGLDRYIEGSDRVRVKVRSVVR